MKSTSFDDQVNTKPNEVRLFVVACGGPAGLGLMAIGTTLTMRLFPPMNQYTLFPGVIANLAWAAFIQFSASKALQMKDRERRLVLLAKLRMFPAASLILGPLGLFTAVMNALLRPANPDLDFYGGMVFALAFGVGGGLLSLLALKARRIPWLVNPV